METELEELEGPGARVRKGRRVRRARPNIEPSGLDISGTCEKPLNSSSGRLGDAMETKLEGLEGPGARVREGRRVWRARPTIEPSGLGIGGTCEKPLNSGSGKLGDMMETELAALEGPGARAREGRRIWRARPTIEPSGLDIGGTCGKPPANGSGDWWDAVEVLLGGLGAWSPICTGGGL
jgi:hypothetical protein